MEQHDDATPHKFFIAIHIGAGYHSPLKSAVYYSLMETALKLAGQKLAEGGTALEAIELAIRFVDS